MVTNFDAADQIGRASTSEAPGLQLSIREFVRRPNLVGSAFPASRHLVETLLRPVDWTKARVVVEYGPGTGPITRAILARMPRDSRLVAIDVSQRFTRHLRRTIDDPRLLAVTACASSATAILGDHGLGPADLIVSGIPFSTISPEQGGRILDISAQILPDNGLFLAYQMRSTIAPMLAERFGHVRKSHVWLNIPPCHLYWAQTPNRNDQSPGRHKTSR
ncbi:phospholipid N-methyltransferase [Novosphingobium sp. PhB57]|uniref:class I SAM-dependent methyltransferase n=1 Tax=Novosphingobium sp. PhB57 TaxID=2485107 RepID=UPI0010488BBF|nr:methyltransferase [Novosphingobium sp. PhB57]TCU51866.1 phospholipid N-methyltransferase [Novosphingobium sp. PhB57]